MFLLDETVGSNAIHYHQFVQVIDSQDLGLRMIVLGWSVMRKSIL